MDLKLQKILSDVDSYIKEKHSSKSWLPGKDWVKYSGPYFNSDEYVSSIKSLLNEWLVMGEDGMKFESSFPKLLGKNYGVVTNSGSSSNLLMMAAMKSKRLYNFPKGTKVITPVAGFPTTFNPIVQMGFEPVFVDIEIDTLNINLDQLEEALSNNHGNSQFDIKILTFAHVLGNPPNMNKVVELIKKYNVVLLEDCCDALGSSYDGKPLGSFGELASCSFYPAHHITMGEGGFVVCNTPEQEKVVRSLREWGRGCYCVGLKANLSEKGCCGKRFSPWVESMPDEIFDHKYVYDEIGYNLKPIELQCSIGLEQIKKLPEINRRRKENYDLLYKIFSAYEEFFILPKAREKADVSWFAFPLTIRDGAPFKRKDFCGFLESNKIQTRNYFGGNLLLQPAYSDVEWYSYTNHNRGEVFKQKIRDFKNIKNLFPVATKVMTDTFFLGTSPVITNEQIDYIKNIVDLFIKNK